jgi:hypothetical protein
VIQAGQSIHLCVLPPPAVAPEPVELAASVPLTDDSLPLPVEQPVPVGTPPPSPSPVASSAELASASAGGVSGPGGCPPRPGDHG